MIGWLRGLILDKQPPALLIDVNGVGYELQAPMSTFGQLPEVGAEASLHTHMVVREDAQLLYGFASRGDRELFRELLKVTGVGARIALTILSGMDGPTLRLHVQNGDAVQLAKLPGIGRKTAERLIVDLRDRLDGVAADVGAVVAGGAGPAQVRALDPVDEAVHALIALGLKPPEASKRATEAGEPGMSSEDIVRRALQGMGKH